MTNGTYGTVKPANITADDCDIFYFYRPTRSSESNDFKTFKQLDRSLIVPSKAESGTSAVVLPGMFDLRLPVDKFGDEGFYTVYIKPREIQGNIVDVSTLAAYPNIRGIVLSKKNFDFSDGDLVGYRVEYFDDSNNRQDIYRIITSNNACEPVAQNLNDSSQKGIRYRFNDSGNLIFCTVSPDTSMSFKSSSTPYIGETNKAISLINTKFTPIMLEIHMVSHDIETVSTMLEGAQIRNLDTGIITTFDKNGGIYHQAAYGNITNTSDGTHHDFKIPSDTNINYDEESRLETIQEQI